jgi:hypothetical protein
MTPVTELNQIRAAAFNGQCLLIGGVLHNARAVYHRLPLVEVCPLIDAGALLLFPKRPQDTASC